jgi:hypothetical protein
MKNPKVNLFLSELYTVATAYKDSNKELRLGQSLMIALQELDKDLYNKIVDTVYDPFYMDIRIPKFEERLLSIKTELQ